MDEPRPIDPTANPDDVKLDENGNPIPEIPSNISEEIMLDMKNIWSVFDSKNENSVTIDELKTIMKALDISVAEDYILQSITEMIDPENSGFMTFERLTIVMEEQLKEKDTLEDLIEQLKKLDKDGDGKIPSPEFKQYMTNMGLKMKPEELEEMMKIADPKGEGSVDIADFADSLCPPKK